ncbi:MAG: hypothetical protein ACKO9Z_15635 [Planctomycetota bacterium]|nr:hypothetical protein [Planctomycetota bacterium]
MLELPVELLEDSRGLSFPSLSLFLVVGLFLWAAGGVFHRFWLVSLATLAGGLVGLESGQRFHLQPIVAGVLFAFTSGALALALVDLAIFLIGALAALTLLRAAAPPGTEPLPFVLGGGLVFLMLRTFWMVLTTAAAGSLVLILTILSFMDRGKHLDAVDWSAGHQKLLLGAQGVLTMLGALAQWMVSRWNQPDDESAEESRQERKPGRKRESS